MSRLSKRVFDFGVVASALPIALPIIALSALAIKVSSKGPIFYLQHRLGQNRRPIIIVKLRTMIEGADKLGAHVTSSTDKRITRLGAFLRKTKFDELPQVWNVLIGEMSIVGPRPEVPRYVKHYRAEWENIFSVKPGLTDLASLVFRNEEALLAGIHERETAYVEHVLPEKLRLALSGIEKSSIKNDIKIIGQTALCIMYPKLFSGHLALIRLEQTLQTFNQKRIVAKQPGSSVA